MSTKVNEHTASANMTEYLRFDEEDLADVSLPRLFSAAHKYIAGLDTGEVSVPPADAFERCEAILKECVRKIDVLSLFSRNEDKDDIQTGHLRYLLVPFLLGALYSNTTERDPMERGRALTRALISYRDFAVRCLDLELLGSEARAEASRDPTEIVGPSLAREEKIARFKREREIVRRLEELEALRGPAKLPDDDDADPADVPGLDEDVEREMWMLRIDQAALKALAARGTIQQELGILKHMAQMRAAGGSQGGQQQDERMRQPGRGEEGAPGPPQMMERLGNIADALSGGRRAEVARGVLRPGHQLPAMSLAELGEIEYREAVERAERQKRAEEERAARKAAVREGSDDEEELRRQRAMDDFKDSVKRGSGNASIKPTR